MSNSEIEKPKRHEYSDHQLGEISGLVKGGLHSQAEISNILGIPRTSVNYIFKRYQETGTTLCTNTRTGRPPKLNERDKQILKRCIEADPNLSYSQHLNLLHKAGIDISRHTLIHYMDELGLRSNSKKDDNNNSPATL
ncbi:hypothetical protein BD770DRAFT_448968 [Pilaira anomala]|nr:hypothetical protein BD770DRAFT_448968 [Pilaira anomala]